MYSECVCSCPSLEDLRLVMQQLAESSSTASAPPPQCLSCPQQFQSSGLMCEGNRALPEGWYLHRAVVQCWQ